MSDNTHNPAGTPISRRPILWAILLGILLLASGVVVAGLGVFSGLLIFNGCMGAATPLSETLAMLWIFGLWPLSVLASALLPPILLGAGRGAKAVMLSFVVCSLIAVFVWIAWLFLGYYWMC